MATSGGDWGIVGVSLVRPDQRDRLAPQDFAYTALELGPDGETAAGGRRDRGRARRPRGSRGRARGHGRSGACASSRLTVTEKGYCHEPATGRLNRAHPDIVHDLAHPDAPRSAPGFLVARARPPPRGRRARPSPCSAATTFPRTADVVRGVVLELARADRPGARRLDRGRGRLPLHHGRPHRPGHQARGHRRGSRRSPAGSTSRR